MERSWKGHEILFPTFCLKPGDTSEITDSGRLQELYHI